jgi:polar amino acid transport system substrate-binding protein
MRERAMEINKSALIKFVGKCIIIVFLIALVAFMGRVIQTQFSEEDSSTFPVYRIAIDPTWYPLQLYGKAADLTIFSEEIIQAIKANQDFSINLMKVESDNLFIGLGNEYEGVLSSFLILEDNLENYISSNPYYLLGPVLILSTSSKIKSINDLKNENIGTINIGLVKNSHPLYSLNKEKAVQFTYYEFNNISQLLNDVGDNILDGAILSLMAAHKYAKSGLYQDKLKIITEPLNNRGLRLIAKSNPKTKKLIKIFNERLKSIKENGVYSRLLSEWDLINPEKL